MTRISVLLPVYNVEPYVADALTSIQSQTFSDIEIVVVDDGSTDGTLRIVEQFASTDGRIKVVRSTRNQGLSAALNLGLTYCRAPFIARMDGDDIALPERLEKQLNFLEQTPGVALVGCASIQIDQSGRPIPGLRIARKPEEKDIAQTILLNTPCLHIWLARHEVYLSLIHISFISLPRSPATGPRRFRFPVGVRQAFRLQRDPDFLLRADPDLYQPLANPPPRALCNCSVLLCCPS